MAENVSAFLLRRLHHWGVTRIYGYPGDGINGILGAFHASTRSSSSRCATRRWRRSWPARTPSSPARSASAWPRPGPGAIHLLNGLYDAKLDQRRCSRSSASRPDVTRRPTTSRKSTCRSSTRTSPPSTSRSYRPRSRPPPGRPRLPDRAGRAHGHLHHRAQRYPGDEPCEEPPRSHGTVHTRGGGHHVPRIVPRDEDLQRAADVLNAGESVAILIGAGALRRGDEVAQVAGSAGRRRREGAARQGGRARRSAVRHGVDRPARHEGQADEMMENATRC